MKTRMIWIRLSGGSYRKVLAKTEMRGHKTLLIKLFRQLNWQDQARKV